MLGENMSATLRRSPSSPLLSALCAAVKGSTDRIPDRTRTAVRSCRPCHGHLLKAERLSCAAEIHFTEAGGSVHQQQGLLKRRHMGLPTILLLADSIPQRPQQVYAGPIGMHAHVKRACCPKLRRQLLQCGS